MWIFRPQYTPYIQPRAYIPTQVVASSDAAATVGLQPAVSATADRVALAAATVTLTPSSLKTTAGISSSSATVGLQPSASGVLDKTSVAVVTVGLQGLAVEARDTPASATASVGFSPSPSASVPVVSTRGAAVSMGMSATASAAFVPAGVASLGRFRRGDSVPYSFTLPALPDAPPVLTVTADAATVDSFPLPILDQEDEIYASRLVSNTFGRYRMVGEDYPLGTLRVKADYSVSGVPASQDVTLDVVDGGDSGGSVISLLGHGRPDATYIVAQLSSGVLVQGRNPHL
jgi:hypothetical protein